ncbi:right-handed parallel beta-helix repeat-containing protein, partial [Acinetobacter baumannii]|uniref:right-handed parallel beta-helix repeat-containing protein n=4 Tax=Pseudomonadota TaxID=1224 RepID=UPI0014901C8A
PVESEDVLIDGVTVKGASDAGIYVGQSNRIVVRNSTAMYNVAGIEIENSGHAEVTNNLATHNTGGILV